MSILYPLKFKPILKPMIWGGNEIASFKQIETAETNIGESWEISGVKGNVSIVSEGELQGKSLEELISAYQDRLVGKSIYQKFGNTFPLLIKFIDAKNDLSIQVHPDDRLAQKRHNSFGKTEMWYVISATLKAFLYSGFEQQITPEEYVEKVKNNTFTETLKKYSVKSGDVFYLPAGRVHAIGAGCFVAEIQQTSDVTYRIYDYNRTDANGNPRELHTEWAKDAIDYTVHPTYKTEYTSAKNQATRLASGDYFETHLLELDATLPRNYSAIDSFVILICIEGHCNIQTSSDTIFTLSQGETMLIPAKIQNLTIIPSESCKIIETYAK